MATPEIKSFGTRTTETPIKNLDFIKDLIEYSFGYRRPDIPVESRFFTLICNGEFYLNIHNYFQKEASKMEENLPEGFKQKFPKGSYHIKSLFLPEIGTLMLVEGSRKSPIVSVINETDYL